MQPQNINKIHKAFNIQAQNFENDVYGFTDKKYLGSIISKVNPCSADEVLEVAAGTCACGRAFAPVVKSVTCIDATKSMLAVGEKMAANDSLDNISFVNGYAEDLPFQNNSFDIVISRLAFHHFTDIHIPFREMIRVLKSKGKLVLIDMEAVNNELRTIQNKIEIMRDNSHTKTLTRTEMTKLFTDINLKINVCDTITVPQKIDNWLDLTNTSAKVKSNIINLMQSEMNGENKTGFYPYMKDGNICFNQIWTVIVGTLI